MLGLPASSRALLAKQLISSLDETETADSEPVWLALAQRRAEELASG
jgi:hypothetical protein